MGGGGVRVRAGGALYPSQGVATLLDLASSVPHAIDTLFWEDDCCLMPAAEEAPLRRWPPALPSGTTSLRRTYFLTRAGAFDHGVGPLDQVWLRS